MSRFYSYLNTAEKLLTDYDGNEPFSVYSRNFFRKNKKYGSNDRKQIARLCYNYFRLGNAMRNLPIREQILTALFLCSDGSDKLTEQLIPERLSQLELPLEEKLKLSDVGLDSTDIFPFEGELSSEIPYRDFAMSFLEQPKLFLRIRPGFEETVLQKLQEAGQVYEQVAENSIALDNGVNVERMLEPDREVVIQDYSSQQIAGFLAPLTVGAADLKIWDCCAGSGGKSILAYDLNPKIELTLTDVRESILHNLRNRFMTAGIKNYRAEVVDLTEKQTQNVDGTYDLVLADVPCTGSGTWSRTPEQLAFFNPSEIDRYAALQRNILDSVVPSIKPGGHLLYITCSVFRKENEEQIRYLWEHHGLRRLNSTILNGINRHADTMFAAVLSRR